MKTEMSTQRWSHLTARHSEHIPVTKGHICIQPALCLSTLESHHLWFHSLLISFPHEILSRGVEEAFKNLCTLWIPTWGTNSILCFFMSTFKLRQGVNLMPVLTLCPHYFTPEKSPKAWGAKHGSGEASKHRHVVVKVGQSKELLHCCLTPYWVGTKTSYQCGN